MNKKKFFLGFLSGFLLIFAISMIVRENLPEARVEQFLVTHIADGDTITVDVSGKAEYVRLIGIDTPETVDQRKKVQCYGPEASARMKELLTGKSVSLTAKPTEDRDDYGRLLRYVFLGKKDIGALMIVEGYARSTCAAFPHPKCALYDQLQKKAEMAKLGRWGMCE